MGNLQPHPELSLPSAWALSPAFQIPAQCFLLRSAVWARCPPPSPTHTHKHTHTHTTLSLSSIHPSNKPRHTGGYGETETKHGGDKRGGAKTSNKKPKLKTVAAGEGQGAVLPMVAHSAASKQARPPASHDPRAARAVPYDRKQMQATSNRPASRKESYRREYLMAVAMRWNAQSAWSKR